MYRLLTREKEREEWYEFGPYRLSPSERLLLRAGQPVPLTPKAFETLVALIERGGHVVSKEELLRRVWPGTVVEEATLAQNIFTLRKALGEGVAAEAVAAAHYIETVPKRGYRFVAPVRRDQVPATPPESLATPKSSLRVVPRNDSSDSANIPLFPPPPQAFFSQRNTEPERGDAPFFSHYRPALLLTGVAVLILAVAGLRWHFQAQGTPRETVFAFQKMKMSRLTDDGRSSLVALSPDGRYVVYVSEAEGQQSLWLKQIATASVVPIVPPSAARYRGLTFSPDSNYVYYVAREKPSAQAGLYRVPALGGSPQQLAQDVWGPITLSPDGRQLAFLRVTDQAESALFIAGADGTGERKISARTLPDIYVAQTGSGPSWSPDGRTIAVPAASFKGGYHANFVGVNAADGRERPLSERQWYRVGQVAWLPDNSGLMAIACDQESGFASQIWHISYPGGEVRRITKDTNEYDGLSLTANARTLATVRSQRIANIWKTSAGGDPQTVQFTSGSYDGASGLAWTPDGRIVYAADTDGNSDLWITDGAQPKRLTAKAGVNLFPAVSPDNRYVVFSSNRVNNFHLWRIDLDGRHPKQLTSGGGDLNPDISPDSRWIIYSTFTSGNQPLWRVGLDGGAPAQVSDHVSFTPVISPDGEKIAYLFKEEMASPGLRVAVAPAAGGPPLRVFELPHEAVPLAGLRWQRDGRALTFVQTVKGVSNLWSLPLDGGPARQITFFTSDLIFGFDWSFDGRTLALSRGTETYDTVLINDLQGPSD